MITLTREVMQMALDAFEAHAKQYPHMVKGYTVDAAQALRAALAQPEPEPVAWRFDQAKYRENDLRGRQWAFNVFSQSKPYMDEMVRNVTPLYTTPPQRDEPEPEPPRFPTALRKMWSGSEVQAWIDEHYTAPPQREWVGLTTDEMKDIADRYHLKPPNVPVAFRAIEAKLKEKNG